MPIPSLPSFAMPASPAWVLGTPYPSQVSLTDTGHGREMFWGPSSVQISGECFHLPNPSPMICPQRGAKGLLPAQISPVSCTAPGKGASGLTGTVKMPSRTASVCVGMSEDQELDVRLQVPESAGRPGTGVVPDRSEGQDQATLPQCSLAVCCKGARSISTPSVAK